MHQPKKKRKVEVKAPTGDFYGFKKNIDNAVFPSCQGGPHNNTIAGIAVQMKDVCSERWAGYAMQVRKNAARFGKALTDKGYKLATGGTDNHLVLWNLRPTGITGSKMEYICDEVSITVNKNAIHGDKSAFSPGGVRIGSPALTSRGFNEEDFVKVAEFCHRAVEIAVAIVKDVGKSLKLFKQQVHTGEKYQAQIKALREDVENFAKGFPMPGFDSAEHAK